MTDVRCPKCNRLQFKTNHRANVVNEQGDIQIQCPKCKEKLNINIKRL